MTKDITADDKFAQFSSPPTEGPTYESMKEIRLSVPLSETDIPEGHYYSVDYNVPDGEKATHKDLGESIEVVILRDCMKTRKWDTEERRNVYDSTEFRSFKEPVVLYDNTVSPVSIKAALPYTHDNKDAPAIGGSGENSLRIQLGLRIRYLAYVLYEDEVYRLSFTATDNAGADENDTPLSFSSYADNSFMHCKHKCSEIQPDHMFFFKIRLGSKVHSKKLRLKTFEVGDALKTQKEKDEVYEKLTELYQDLSTAMWNKFGRALEETDRTELDDYSKKMVEYLEGQGTDLMLFSRKEAGEGLPEPDVKDAEVVDVAEAVDDVFPPSEEEMKKHKKEKEEATNI